MTLNDIIKVAQSLPDIRRDAVASLRRGKVTFWHDYERVKGRLNREVGWNCPSEYPDFMHTSEAHDLAYEYVFKGLV